MAISASGRASGFKVTTDGSTVICAIDVDGWEDSAVRVNGHFKGAMTTVNINRDGTIEVKSEVEMGNDFGDSGEIMSVSVTAGGPWSCLVVDLFGLGGKPKERDESVSLTLICVGGEAPKSAVSVKGLNKGRGRGKGMPRCGSLEDGKGGWDGLDGE